LPIDPVAVVEAGQRRVFCDKDAVLTDDTGSYVWSVDDQQRLRRIDVKTGPVRDSRIEIVNGLSGGENVVITPPGVKSGQLVRMAP
jgi:hypothetical protein